jgi:hypothetical protein
MKLSQGWGAAVQTRVGMPGTLWGIRACVAGGHSFVAFKQLSGLVGGTMDGVPTDLLNSYPALKAYHTRFASLPAIAKYCEHVFCGCYLA